MTDPQLVENLAGLFVVPGINSRSLQIGKTRKDGPGKGAAQGQVLERRDQRIPPEETVISGDASGGVPLVAHSLQTKRREILDRLVVGPLDRPIGRLNPWEIAHPVLDFGVGFLQAFPKRAGWLVGSGRRLGCTTGTDDCRVKEPAKRLSSQTGGDFSTPGLLGVNWTGMIRGLG